ncbi:MAG: hypothetical protein WCT05_15090 [Lentisphaeria bacterium]
MTKAEKSLIQKTIDELTEAANGEPLEDRANLLNRADALGWVLDIAK